MAPGNPSGARELTTELSSAVLMIGSGLKGLTGLGLEDTEGIDGGIEGTGGGTGADTGDGPGVGAVGATGGGTGFGMSCLESSVISPFLPMSIIRYSIQPKSVF